MTERQYVILAGDKFRARAIEMIRAAPAYSIVEVRKRTRSTEQNVRMWAMLADIHRQKKWEGILDEEDWKAFFMHALKGETRLTRSIDGMHLVPLGYRTSKLTVGQMVDLQTIMERFAAEHGIRLMDDEQLNQLGDV